MFDVISISNIWMYLFVFAGLLALIRAGLGPTFADRFIGIGAFVNVITLMLVVYAIQIKSQFYLDVAILLVMLSFVGSLAIAKYSPKINSAWITQHKPRSPRRAAPLGSSAKAEKPKKINSAWTTQHKPRSQPRRELK